MEIELFSFKAVGWAEEECRIKEEFDIILTLKMSAWVN